MAKTNVIRILEAAKIQHSIHNYKVDEEALDAITVANKIGADPESVFKTLIAQGDKNGLNVFVIPGSFELNLKLAASASRNKKVEMIKMKDLLPLTGYIRGGCSPVGMKKQFPTYLDETAQLFEYIYISAGVRGTQVKLKPSDLLELVDAKYAELI